MVASSLQTAAEARAELATLFADPDDVAKWLARMALVGETRPAR